MINAIDDLTLDKINKKDRNEEMENRSPIMMGQRMHKSKNDEDVHGDGVEIWG